MSFRVGGHPIRIVVIGVIVTILAIKCAEHKLYWPACLAILPVFIDIIVTSMKANRMRNVAKNVIKVSDKNVRPAANGDNGDQQNRR